MPMFTVLPPVPAERTPDFEIGVGDRFPSLEMSLGGFTGPLPEVTLVKFLIRPRAGGATLIRTARVASYQNRTVAFDWGLEDTAVAGDFDANFEIELEPNRRITLPNGIDPTTNSPRRYWVRVTANSLR